MTEELKTLKDFEHIDGLHAIHGSSRIVVAPEELRTEAIKWIKLFQSRKESLESREASGAEHSFKNFFNITEEDLK